MKKSLPIILLLVSTISLFAGVDYGMRGRPSDAIGYGGGDWLFGFIIFIFIAWGIIRDENKNK